MRLHRAALLVSSVSILSALNVLSAPLKVVVVEKVKPKDAGDFLRSVRIGLAGANVNFREAVGAHVGTDADTNADVLDPDFVRIALPNSNSESDNNPGPSPVNADGNANSDKMAFPELPSFVKDAMEEAMDEARKAATHIAEKEHELEEELKGALDNEHAIIDVMHCSDQKSWRSKANKIENWFRKLVGLSLIQRSECPESDQLPIKAQSESQAPDEIVSTYHVVTEENSVPVPPPAALKPSVEGDVGVPCHKPASFVAAGPAIAITSSATPRPRLRHGRLGGWRRPQTFLGRLEKALYSLSPWEGRALAFVIGCGIGVLLRMVYVFIVLGVRYWKCRRLQAIQLAEQDAQVTIFDINELEEEELPPPLYKEDEIVIVHEKRFIDGN